MRSDDGNHLRLRRELHTEIQVSLATLEERWLAHRREHDQHETNHMVVHERDQTAIRLAVENIDRRLEEMNEFRRQIEQERALYVRREVLDERLHNVERLIEGAETALSVRLDLLATQVTEMRNREANIQGRFWALGIGVTMVVIVVNVVIQLLGR